eukprot:Clim_evm72s150 gene=Clim_evmTU72s150
MIEAQLPDPPSIAEMLEDIERAPAHDPVFVGLPDDSAVLDTAVLLPEKLEELVQAADEQAIAIARHAVEALSEYLKETSSSKGVKARTDMPDQSRLWRLLQTARACLLIVSAKRESLSLQHQQETDELSSKLQGCLDMIKPLG